MLKKWTNLAATIGVLLVAGCANNQETDSAVSTELEQVQENGVLTVATSGTLFPSSYHDEETNELTGYETEVLRKIAERLGVEIVFDEMGYDGILTSVLNGTADVAAGVDITEERQEKFQFSDPTKYTVGGIVVRETDDSGIETLEDVAGKKTGGAATSIWSDMARELGAEIIPYDNATNDVFFRDIASGRIDIVMHDYFLSATAVEKFSDLGVKMSDVQYNHTTSAMIFSKEDKTLADEINNILEELRNEGVLSELSKEFYNGQDISEPMAGFEELPVVEVE
ncbi:transporter substrate-binding domain-containing protein [Desemzia sp. RIT804]|uniref:transporter substrate-binding domain-containing protein n=1 Tax=Desemzia sp. RIT 804 TaxID=2810209 RepID=UPI001951BB84|nr:transporter substrate-binding domain-containing protein [Desemzia sp. RIT 804]MBM6615499.1 transporter substrate-binding domain-containing protein [Desemzia sp. RIT 804]